MIALTTPREDMKRNQVLKPRNKMFGVFKNMHFFFLHSNLMSPIKTDYCYVIHQIQSFTVISIFLRFKIKENNNNNNSNYSKCCKISFDEYSV